MAEKTKYLVCATYGTENDCSTDINLEVDKIFDSQEDAIQHAKKTALSPRYIIPAIYIDPNA